MTQAICLKCGHEKFGALTPCSSCQFLPTDVVDRAKSVLLSDHHVDRADLKTLASAIANGEEPDYPEDALNEYIVLFERELINGPDQLPKSKWYSTVLTFLGFLTIPLIFFLLMPIAFSLGEKLIGRNPRPSAPLVTGAVQELELTDSDASPWIGRGVKVYSTYVQIDDSSGTTLIPRDRVIRIVVKGDR